MARLPQPGGDSGTWGSVLNEFLSVEHAADGSHKYASANVKHFGAKGDGVTDDTAAIHAALASLGNTGGSVYFPKGNYKVTNIQLPLMPQGVGIVLIGAAIGATKLTASAAGSMITIGTGDPSLDAQFYGVYDMHLEGNSTADVGITLQHTRFTNIHRVAFWNFRSTCIKALGNMHNYFARIQGCRFRAAPIGVWLDGGNGIGANSNWISECHFIVHSQTAVFINAGDTNIVEKCEFATSIPEGVQIVNNATNNKILFNHFDGPTKGVGIESSASYTYLMANTGSGYVVTNASSTTKTF